MINKDNYFSKENNTKYMSASQFRAFQDCEAAALAVINGEHEQEKTVALLVGSYVDAYFSKEIYEFTKKNPEIFTQKGELKAEFRHAQYIIDRIERDPMMMKYLSGEQQVVKTGEISGVPFKIKIDSYHPGKAIVDLKIMKDFQKIWLDGLKVSFIEYWKYDLQMSIYQAIEGNKLPIFICAATKEKPEPDITIISIPQERLDFCLEIVENNVKRYANLKNGIGEAVRCEKCDYCRKTKKVTAIFDYHDFGG